MTGISYNGVKVWVIGDIMLDRYIHGQVERISPEAPVPVMSYQSTNEKPGGAANVALNCKGLGAEVLLIGILGMDPEADTLIKLLESRQIGVRPIRFENRPTTVKTRLMSDKQQLIRIDREESRPLDSQEETLVNLLFDNLVQNTAPDVIILQDYDKGTLFPQFISKVIDFAKVHKIPVTADPKNRNFFAYRGASLFKPKPS